MISPQQMFEQLTNGLPTFDDGRINFTGVQKAPVLNAIVYHDGWILIVKRSDKVGAYQGLWNGISGFIDEPKPIEDFAKQEINEELGVDLAIIKRIVVGEPYEVDDRSIDRLWFVYPVLVELHKLPDIVLDWEHTDFAWITPKALEEFAYVKDFDKSMHKALAYLE
ncbi:NUDIX hydrolase [candidate division TM7 genomosp. GTL1]|nr:NUDIX hydrolase [candidate division TM7 genomosp. GTL1]